MKKGLLIMLAAVSVASVAHAKGGGNETIGCGWGTQWFGDKDKKLHLIMGSTTNAPEQSFGISSETLGCTAKGGWVKNDKKQAVYAEVNLQKLSKEMAQGGGEYLSAFATLLGARDESAKQAFFKLTQEKYASIFPTEKTDAATMLRNVKAAMAADPKLAAL